MKGIINFCLVLSISLSSCFPERKEPKKVEVFKVLIAKNIEKVNATALSSGSTDYILAFDDGYTKYTSFGFYSCLQLGDTVKFTHNEGGTWLYMHPKCK